jgi:hypothetical protein
VVSSGVFVLKADAELDEGNTRDVIPVEDELEGSVVTEEWEFEDALILATNVDKVDMTGFERR